MITNISQPIIKDIVKSLVSGEGAGVKVFSFITEVPEEFIVNRAGTVATERDINGNWIQSTANEGRIHHDSAGTPVGILIEPEIENKATPENFAPTVTTGVSIVSGDGAASVVTDTDVAAATIDGSTYTALQNGDVIELTAVAVDTIYDISGQAGNTNDHSWRIGIAADATGFVGQIRYSDIITPVAINNPTTGDFYEYTRTQAPNNAIRTLQIRVTPGNTVRFSFNDWQETATLTSPIINPSGGSTSTRNRDEVVAENIDTAPWFDQDAGAIVWVGSMKNVANADQGFFGVADGNGATNVIGMRSLSSDGYVDGQFISGGTDQSFEKIAKPLDDGDFAVGVVWDDSEFKFFANHGITTLTTEGITPIGGTLDNLRLGRWREFVGYAHCEVKAVYVIAGPTTLAQAANTFISSNDRGYVLLGQSNASYKAKNQVLSDYTNGGEVAGIKELDVYYTSGRNFVCNAAVGGSGLYRRNNATLYWLENDGTTAGPLLIKAKEMIAANTSTRLIGGLWNQGESNGGETRATIELGVKEVFDQIREVSPGLNFFIESLVRRTDNATADPQYEAHEQAYDDLVNDNAWIHRLPSTKVLPMQDETGVTDQQHVSDLGWEENGPWIARKMADVDGQSVSGPVDGSEITNVTRSGTSVTVTLTHPTGITDFTPVSGIEGFVFEDDGTPINITAAVRTDSTTITLTLASTPTGTEVLKYTYGTAFGVDPANLVRGNDTYNLPLQVNSTTL